jgi:hypothetical protein
VGGIELVFRLLDDETFHGIHPPSEMLTDCIIAKIGNKFNGLNALNN